MDQRVSLITLGVADLGRARGFYESIGWHTNAAPEDDVVFFQAGGMILGLWGRGQLAQDSGIEDNGGWGGVALAMNVGSPAEVDAVLEEARAAGASVPRAGAETFWVAIPACSSIPTVIRGRSPTTPIGRWRPTARFTSSGAALQARVQRPGWMRRPSRTGPPRAALTGLAIRTVE